MANISRIKLDETTYEIKDAQAARASDLALKQDALTAGNGIAIDNSDVIRTTGIPFGTCDSTSTSKVFTATVPGIYKLEDGVCCIIKNGVVTSESGFTLNVNGLGAKPSYSNMATGNDVTPTDPTRDTTIFNINYAMLFIYSSTIVDGGGWICYRGYDANTNTIGYQLRHNSSTLPASDKFYRYRLLFTSADGTKFVPANTSSSTNGTASRTVNLRPIDPFGEIVYYSSTSAVNAGANPAATVLWDEYVLNLGYSFNRTGAALVLTYPKPVYIKCAPRTDGSAIIDDDTPYVQALPSSNDNNIYIFLGIAYSATNIELLPNHTVYYHDGTGIRIWTGKSITKVSELTNDSGFITSSSLNGLASTSYVDTKVAGVVNSAPETLDTLKELATALGNDPNFATTIATQLGNKVDKETGKSLMTDAEHTKLASIAEGAEVNVQPNWTQTNTSADDYIKNKPNLATVATSGSYNDLTNKPTIPTVDSSLTGSSQTNPVQGSAIYNALANKAPKTIYVTTEKSGGVYHVDSGHTFSEAYNIMLNGGMVIFNHCYCSYYDDQSMYFSSLPDIEDGFMMGGWSWFDDESVVHFEYKYPMTEDHPAYGISSTNITNWNNAGKPFIANLIPHLDENDSLDYYTCNKTYAQLCEAIAAGKQVYLFEDEFYGVQLEFSYDGRLVGDSFLEFNSYTRGLEGNTFEVDIFDDNHIEYRSWRYANSLDVVNKTYPTSYSLLVTKRNNSLLTAGQWYRITDYTCTTTQTDTQSAGHQFDILIQATSPNTLSEEAKAIRHEGDTYFEDSNLEDWKIWYCLDNDTIRFAWADTTNGKGVIYRMIDEYNNDCPYDFKNIQFKRYKITATTKTDTWLVGKYMAATDYMSGHTIDANDFVWCYTFNGYYASWSQDDEYIDSENLGSDAVDLSKFNYSSFYDENSGSQGCARNVIPYYIAGDSISQPRTSLNNIVMYGWVTDVSTLPSNYEDLYGDLIFQMMSTPYSNTFGDSCNHLTFGYGCNSNTFGDGCNYITFGSGCEGNKFGWGCSNNAFGYGCSSNTFGNGCYANTFGNNCYFNTFGNGFSSNKFGNNYQYSIFGNNCSSNTFGNSCQSNKFGNGYQSNTFGDFCSYNTFGNSCYHNTFGDSCSYNTFGNYCTYNTFVNYCQSNTFGDGCNNNTFSKSYTQDVIIENGNMKITLTSTQTSTGSNPLRNITIAQGVNNTNTTKIISHNTLKDTFRTTYTVDDNGAIYAITPDKYSEWDKSYIPLYIQISGTTATFKDINNNSVANSTVYSWLNDSNAHVVLYDNDSTRIYYNYLCEGTDEYNFYSLSPNGIYHIYLSYSNGNFSVTLTDDWFVSAERKINNKYLVSDITLTASDVGADVFVVNIEDDENGGYTCDKTNAEIYAAWQAGRNIICIQNDEFVFHLGCEPYQNSAVFIGSYYDEFGSDTQTWISTNQSTGVQTVDRSTISYQQALDSGTNIKTINNQSLLGSGNLTANDIGAATVSDVNTAISNLVGSAPATLNTLNELATALDNDPNFATTITNKIAALQVHVGSVAGKLYRDDVNGGGNFTVKGNSGCIPNLTAGTFLVSIYAKSATQSYTFKFNFGSVSYNLSTTNGEINDVREITIPSNGTFSGSVLNGSVAAGTILYVVMYDYLTPVSTVGVAAVTNRYSDLDGTPTFKTVGGTNITGSGNIPLPTVNDGTLTIQKNGTTLGTFTANQSSNTTVNITVPTNASDVGAVPTTRKINDKELSTNITLTASDIGALPSNTVIPSVINNLTTTTTGSALDASQGKALKDLVDGKTSKFVVEFTLSGTTISNPTKTFAEIQTAYDAGNIVLARDNANSLYYLLYCVDTGCGFFCSDSGTLYDISVNSSDTWTYQETNISQLELDLSDKSQIIYMQKVNNVWKKLSYNSSTGTWSVNNTTLTTGNTKNIYLDKDNNDLYYWNGSEFTLLSEDKVLSDWNLTDSTKVDYIKNKPSIPTTASDINAMSTSHVANAITSNDINNWNAKADVVTLVTVSGTGSVTLALDANKFYKFGTLTSLTLTLNSVSNGLGIYAGKFTASSTGCTLSVPASVTESIDNPDIMANGTYEFNIMDNILLMVQI